MKDISTPRNILALIAGILFMTTVSAQSYWSLNPEVGASFSMFGKDAAIQKNRTGFIGGLGITYSKSSFFALTGKVLYHQKGNTMDSANLERSLRLDYLEVPILARFFLIQEGRFRPNLFVGPTFSYLLYKSYETNDNGSLPPGTRKEDFNTFDFGVTGGIGLNYRITESFRLLLDARYNYGISDIMKSAAMNVNNQGVAVTLGVSFAIFNGSATATGTGSGTSGDKK